MTGHHSFKRSTRLQELILEEISKLIQNGLKDPRIGFATVTHVALSDNLKHAKVYISVMGTEQEKEDTLHGLTHAAGFFRKFLGKTLYVKAIPELVFLRDDTAEYAGKITQLLNRIHDERSDQHS